jgi:hypothetical protein
VTSLLHSLARRLIRRGLRRGLVEGSAAWVVIGAAAWVVHLVTRPEEPRVAREDLRLGESVLVTHVAAPAVAHGRWRDAMTDGRRSHAS